MTGGGNIYLSPVGPTPRQPQGSEGLGNKFPAGKAKRAVFSVGILTQKLKKEEGVERRGVQPTLKAQRTAGVGGHIPKWQ